jgi:hypothetical protein
MEEYSIVYMMKIMTHLMSSTYLMLGNFPSHSDGAKSKLSPANKLPSDHGCVIAPYNLRLDETGARAIQVYNASRASNLSPLYFHYNQTKFWLALGTNCSRKSAYIRNYLKEDSRFELVSSLLGRHDDKGAAVDSL